MAIRLQDIANDLNLSKMTISKVLRGQTDVSAETKARVLKRMKELNYRPNISARGLRTGQTYSVGMVVPSLANPAVALMVRGINEVFRPASYSLVLSSIEGDDEMEERETELHLSRQVDALIFCPRSDASAVPQALTETTVPVIYAGTAPPRAAGLSVGLREAEVGKFAAEHLLGRRCRRIVYLRGPRTAVADQRFAGFREAHRDAGVSVRQDWIFETHPGASDYRSGFEIMQRLIASRVRPDGIVAYTDLLAAGARDAVIAAAIEVPKQLQIIGCGNVADLCETGISLTSIDLAHEEIGRRVARMTLKRIEEKGETAQRSVTLSPKIVERASTRAN
ncbi:LacI family DNA-binding transcriptional regulator [Edaphobacter flagellatus]|uniref:LacI family DNA-binding transcriptional regulator n=1 Tax=Edaphobacter flagellatus TaxID=1933044 RepID=UPI0021B1685E|nr:LacI family DNA-binding transcriptional regulator [Edaphobacter flagellatus]